MFTLGKIIKPEFLLSEVSTRGIVFLLQVLNSIP